MIGTSIAHYKITAKIGAGGMGEVWRATDTKLNRDVALKILPEIFSADAERMARFSREAQVLASLNHANIAAIYGVEEHDGRRVLVLELVEGEDLHRRLASGPVPVDETLEIARQIAEALEAAHENGVVHRDLKPANVKLTPGGAVKVLDFGLAKALEGDPASGMPDPRQSHSPTLTQAATQAGMILGTAAYMSPEQAKGKPVDRRADIFSYGAVLFEMLAGRQCFAGETISETLASVIKDDPDWSLLPEETPPAVAGLVRRCLEKGPKQRLRDIGEARIILAAVQRGDAGASALATLPGIAASGDVPGSTPDARGGEASGGPGTPAGRGLRPVLWLALTALLTAVAAIIGWEEGLKNAPSAPYRQFSVSHDQFTAGFARAPAISPDGRHVAYVAEERLWIRDLDSLSSREVPQSEDPRAPCWSPDGAWLAWTSGGNLYKMRAGGGQPAVVSQLGERSVHAAAWGEDGSIYLTGAASALRTVSELGGEPRTHLDSGEDGVVDFHSISVLPGDRGIIYTVHGRAGADSVEVMTGGRRKQVLHFPGERIEGVSYDPAGYLVAARLRGGKGLWAIPFSLEDLESTGDPLLLDPDGSWPSLSREGTLVYARGSGSARRELVLVDRQGQVLETLGEPQDGLSGPQISWDAKRVLFSAIDGGNRDVHVLDLARGTRTRITFEEAGDGGPAWLPGDEFIAYSSDAALMVRAADGTGEARMIAEAGNLPSFRPGQPHFAFAVYGGATAWDIWYGSLGPDGSVEGSPEEFLGGPGQQYDVEISPGGDLLAYSNRLGGREEIYVMKFPGKEGRWQVSTGEGYWPRWSRAGDEIYFTEEWAGGTRLMAAAVERSPTLRFSTPHELFNNSSAPGLVLDGRSRPYDVHPDGKRFLLTRVPEGEQKAPQALVISLNWTGAIRGGER